MKFDNLSFIVTDDCNFRCSYCFQSKEKKYIENSTIEKAIIFFMPFLESESRITFFGGEPLLAFDAVRYTIDRLEKHCKEEREMNPRKFIYNLTSNGSLVTDKIIDFFDRYRFELMVSFDGLTQDDARQKGTHDQLKNLVQKIKCRPSIDFSTNSVFTPQNVSSLFDSIKYVLELEVCEVLLSVSPFQPWDEKALEELEHQLEKLSHYLLKYYCEKKRIPIPIFREKKSVPGTHFMCSAGIRRVSIAPDGQVWGCYLFHDYLKNKQESSDFKTYSLGTLDEFIMKHETIYPKILANYKDLRQDRFFTEETFCFLCEDVVYCRTCPINGAYSTGMIGKNPPWICELNRTQRRVVEQFQSQLKRHSGNK